MKTILVPTDFSKCAGNALRYALEIARQTGASITLLHVIYPHEGVDNNVYAAFWSDSYVQERLKALRGWVKKFTRGPELKQVDLRLECRIGFPVGTISETARQQDASLIMMGTTGTTGLEEVLLGSIARGVLAHSTLPVFVVPPKASFRQHARFALATDFKMPVGKISMQLLRELLYLQHTGLDVVHVSDHPGGPNRQQERVLSEKLGTIPHDFHYLHDRDVVQAVRNFMESTDCNGLVTVAHDHPALYKWFHKSVSQSLAHHTKVPILVLHDL